MARLGIYQKLERFLIKSFFYICEGLVLVHRHFLKPRNVTSNFMREPIIYRDDPKIESNMYDFYTFMQYDGKLFTGTILYEDNKSYVQYKNGNVDGRSISYHLNGQIEEDCIYIDGNYISGKHWYENGQLRYDSENNYVIFKEDGILTQKNGNWFYKNGNERLTRNEKGTKIYTSTGNLAIVTEPSDLIINNYPTSKIIYYHKILSAEYKDLQEHIYMHPEDNFNFRGGVFVLLNSWIIELYRTNNKKEALYILNKMINDSENRLKENLNYRVKHIEENFIHNSKIFVKRLESGEFDYNNNSNINNNLSTIIF